jgi:tripartite-type tricarboxylate transporter receptor subunit TctC
MDKYKTTEGARRLAKLVLASGEFGRPLVTPPGVPGERLKILRDAFDKSLNDPGIKADAEKRRLELDPTSGADLESLAKEVMSSPADVVQRVQKLLGK